MTRVFRPCLEVLPSAQRCLWPRLQPSLKLGLVLYGGTAIALRLGHRASADFDFFTDKPLDKEALRAALPFISGAAVLQDQADTLTVLVAESEARAEIVKLSFFGGIGFGRIGEPEATDDGVVRVASLVDLMATKAKVILQRVEARDYQDIAAMIRAGVSLSIGLAAARALYGPAFQPSESLKAMVYFEGGDLNTLSAEDKETLIDAASRVRDLPKVQIAARNLGLADERRSTA